MDAAVLHKSERLPTMKRFFSVACLLAATLTVQAHLSYAQTAQVGDVKVQAVPDAPPASFDEVVDRAIAQETRLLTVLRGLHPIAETYIQNMVKDADFGAVPKTDHYFLGKIDLSKGVTTASFLPKSSRRTRAFQAFTQLFALKYLPRGFAQMMLIDGTTFDRGHYDFELVRREFLGDVRTYVVMVKPKKGAGKGRFVGRLWIEDKDFAIVRFNGTYSSESRQEMYMHFDSWRQNVGPDLWVPSLIYTEESNMKLDRFRKVTFKAVTHVWGYGAQHEEGSAEFTSIQVDLPTVQDKSEQAADNSPLESKRAWERQGEDNILHRMEKAAILAPSGDVEKVLETVVNNLIITNKLDISPEVRVRVILTSPLETFTVGHTVVISRGLLDTLPDEPSLAAILAHELAHISLGQVIDTRFAFSDRVMFDDEETLKRFRFVRKQSEEDDANKEAVRLLETSPYKDKMTQAGLYLKALGAQSDRLPSLIKALFGSQLAQKNNVTRLSDLIQRSPELQRKRVEQIAALPLGGRTKLDPWTDRLQMARFRAITPQSALEKMPFEITPVYLHLTRQAEGGGIAEQSPANADGSPAATKAPLRP